MISVLPAADHFRRTAGGNVGIGTVSPASKLQVSGGQVAIALPSTMEPTGTTQTVDFNAGNIQTINLGSATGDVTLTFSNPVAEATYVLKVIRGANGYNLIWPGAVLWSGGTTPTITTTNGKVDIVTMLYDGSNYYSSILPNF